jgi:hypothetical protein
MIDQIKKCEKIYLNNLKENYSSFDDCKLLDTQLNEIEDTFRNPNLLILTIEELQQKKRESLNEIQVKLNEITKIKDNLKATNEFKPNLSLLNPNETSCFGSIKLNGYWLNVNLFNSEILTDESQLSELLKLCKFSPNSKFSLLYRGTRDGFGSNEFHSKCDGHSNTLTIYRAGESEFIFGGFTSVSWDSSNDYKPDPNAFLFSLANRDNIPLKMKINPYMHKYAIYCHSECGPSFGNGYDIRIANNSNTMNSSSNLGFTYKHYQYEQMRQTNEATYRTYIDMYRTFLAGSREFQLDEIEVYQKE